MRQTTRLLDDAVRQLADQRRQGPDDAGAVHRLRDAIVAVIDGGSCPDLTGLATGSVRHFLSELRSLLLSGRGTPQVAASDYLLAAAEAVDVVDRAIGMERQPSMSAFFDGASAYGVVVEVAHDMRSPLNAILLLAQTEMARASGDSERDRRAALVYAAVSNLSTLVEDLVDSSRPDGGLSATDPVAFSVRELLASVRDVVAPVADEKQIALRIRATRPDRRLGHPIELRRILLNLATNAVKCTAHGSVVLRAHARADGRMEFSVSDTGVGMPRDMLPLLFQPFRPHDCRGRQRTFSSSGLGLSVCRRLADAMGAELSVRSKPGRGTTFTLTATLPVAESASAPVAPGTACAVGLTEAVAPWWCGRRVRQGRQVRRGSSRAFDACADARSAAVGLPLPTQGPPRGRTATTSCS